MATPDELLAMATDLASKDIACSRLSATITSLSVKLAEDMTARDAAGRALVMAAKLRDTGDRRLYAFGTVVVELTRPDSRVHGEWHVLGAQAGELPKDGPEPVPDGVPGSRAMSMSNVAKVGT